MYFSTLYRSFHNSKLLKFYYKLYRNQPPCYFDSFLPTYGTSHYPLRYDGLHLPHANHMFCEVNAKYQLHKLLHAISHPHLCKGEGISYQRRRYGY